MKAGDQVQVNAVVTRVDGDMFDVRLPRGYGVFTFSTRDIAAQAAEVEAPKSETTDTKENGATPAETATRKRALRVQEPATIE